LLAVILSRGQALWVLILHGAETIRYFLIIEEGGYPLGASIVWYVDTFLSAAVGQVSVHTRFGIRLRHTYSNAEPIYVLFKNC
jgi:hypothetical protein